MQPAPGGSALSGPAPVVEPEWWERIAVRRDRWRADHPTAALWIARVRALALWLGLLWLGVLLVFFPELRLGMRAWLGCLWLVVLWFVLAHTKTLTLSGYGRFFSVSVVWSAVIGAATAALSGLVGEVGDDGPGIGIAAFSEEALKLLPVVVLVLLAPRRVSRFAVVDWLLLGLAGGAAFLGVEEYLRRVNWELPGLFSELGRLLSGIGSDDGMPAAWTRFGLGLLPSGGESEHGAIGGHFVATGTVTVCAGLGVAIWRHVSSRAASGATSSGRITELAWRLVAVALPAGAFALAVVDHAGWNASAAAGSDWLDPSQTTMPLGLRLAWSISGHGHGREALLVLLLVVALLVDAWRLTSSTEGIAGARAPSWLERFSGDLASATKSPHAQADAAALARGAALGIAGAVTALLVVVTRDTSELLAAHTKVDGESRWTAMRRGRAAAGMQRTARDVAFEWARGDRPVTAYRAAASAALLALLVVAVVVGPVQALLIGDSVVGADALGWLAAQLDGLASWWDGLGIGQQIAIGIGIAALVALSGGSLGLAFGISGVATFLLEKGHGAADFTRDPRGATRHYLTTATPASLFLDAVDAILTFAPGNFAGAAGGRLARSAVDDYLRDPAAWRAARQGLMRGDRGAIDFSAFRHTDPTLWDDPVRRQQWVDARYTDPNLGNNGMRRPAAPQGDDLAYQLQTTGAEEIRLVTPKGDRIWADGLGVDPDGVVALDAKFVRNPGRSIYEGNAPDFVVDRAMKDFDDEILRYADVIRDPGNPISRLRLYTSTPEAATFLEQRARSLLGPNFDLQVVHVPKGAP